MPRAARTCIDCPTIITTGNRCTSCTTQRHKTPRARDIDRARGTATQRGYTSTGHQRFRRDVLTRDPICVICRTAWATVADHYPVSRRDLQAAGLDPNDPTRGRGLCIRCHNRSTAKLQPGGWNARKGGG